MFSFFRNSRPKDTPRPEKDRPPSRRDKGVLKKSTSASIKNSPAKMMNVETYSVQVVPKAYARSMTMSVQLTGVVRVTAPKNASAYQIHKFVLAHKSWIDKYQEQYFRLRQAHPKKVGRAGEVFLILGKEHRLQFDLGCKREFEFALQDRNLVVKVPPQLWTSFRCREDHPEVIEDLKKYLLVLAKKVLRQRLQYYSGVMGLAPSSISFRSQKTRWGSCSQSGHVSLNWRLIVAPLSVMDYVIIHELAHLRYFDHSTDFWNLVARHAFDFEIAKKWLNENQFAGDFLSKRSALYADILY